MQEEIFGPILSILTYQSLKTILDKVNRMEKPLAAYLFSNNKTEKALFLSNLSFGGGCINDAVMHITNPNLPFGGVGNPGIGNYHGEYGFNAFSRFKSVMHKPLWGEPKLKYPPYTDKKLRLFKKIV